MYATSNKNFSSASKICKTKSKIYIVSNPSYDLSASKGAINNIATFMDSNTDP